MKNWLWTWCLINTILIGLLGMCFGLYESYDHLQDKHIEQLEHRCDVQQAQINAAKSDSIIVNINLEK